MKTITINRRKTTFFSELANQINDNQEALEKYIHAPMSMANCEQQIAFKQRQFSIEQRTLLHDMVSKQMATYAEYEKVAQHIDSPKEGDAFTVTAGHRLDVFTGPLY